MSRIVAKLISWMNSLPRVLGKYLLITFVLITLFFEFTPMLLPDFFAELDMSYLVKGIETDKVQEYIIGIWQIQASVSIIVFSLLSIYFDKSSLKAYGITVREFIKSNTQYLRYENVVFISLSLIIVNYLNFLYKLFNSAIGIMIMSMIVITIYIIQSINLLIDAEKFEEHVLKAFLFCKQTQIDEENKAI